ncbi:uncharacterized protein LOC120186432 [Hibiscus syriacus]|uniref:uncharacterized protein LOC120186432 n=1 Tax=Hibiscus syriacus TaxID=106335 RepID=UPI0019236C3A|nr:uncharacterized protein LOC120186432 [Hibiscus syriacus]
MSLIENVTLSDFVDDFLGWSGKGDGLFSVKSCRMSFCSSSEATFEWNKWVWNGLAPPRVETFLWQLCHGKVAVREELKKRGIPVEDGLCPLCHLHEESVGHLFFSCVVVGELWTKFLRLWEISTALSQDPISILGSWSFLRKNSCIWKFIPRVVLWSIWKVRNLVVFENWKVDTSSLFFLTRFRLAKWFLAKYPLVRINSDILVGDPIIADKCQYSHVLEKTIYSNAITLATFSIPVGPGTPTLAELKAIKEGIVFFFSSKWANKGKLIIESDCKSAVDWTSNQNTTPVFFSSMVEEIGASISAKDIVLRWIPRSCNVEADKLAKEGIG